MTLTRASGARFPGVLVVALLALGALGLAVAVGAQESTPPEKEAIPLEVEFGNRWVDVSGNEDMYRSQIDERDGLLLRSFHLGLNDTSDEAGFFDRFRLDADGIGAGPDQSVRLDVGLHGVWSLRLGYRASDQYSALPNFANPLFARGVIPGQHTIDRHRESLDLRLEILPGGMITPIVEYARLRDRGPGTSTVHVGQDEFLLDTDTHGDESEVRGGIGFHAGPVAGEVTYGVRSIETDESLSLAGGAGVGNNLGNVLGVPVHLDEYHRESSTEIEAPVATAHVVASLLPGVRLIGSYVQSKPETESSETESLTGELVSFQLARFFEGRDEAVAGWAESNESRGSLRLEAAAGEWFDMTAGWMRRDRDLEGYALITSLYRDTHTFDGTDPRDLEEILEADTRWERVENVFDLRVSSRSLGPFGVWAGGAVIDEETILTAAPEEIVVPGGQSGNIDRQIDRLEAGVRFDWKGLHLSGEWQGESADEIVVRTDYLDRDRFRLRAGWSMGDRLKITATADRTDLDNEESGVLYESEITELGGLVEYRPLESLGLRVGYSDFQSESSMPIRNPRDFTTGVSLHEEDGWQAEFGADWTIGKAHLLVAASRFENDGNFAFQVERARFEAGYDFTDHIGVAFEAARDKYEEEPYLMGDYTANRYGLYVRWRQ